MCLSFLLGKKENKFQQINNKAKDKKREMQALEPIFHPLILKLVHKTINKVLSISTSWKIIFFFLLDRGHQFTKSEAICQKVNLAAI